MLSFVVSQMSRLAYCTGFWTVRFVIFAALLASEFINNPSLPPQYTYDYIIVGAGTAGNVILSEMPPDADVLLVEAGAKTEFSFLKIPIITPALQRSPLDWSFVTERQNYACGAMKGKSCRLAAGRGFGGSNILNNMIYHRGSESDCRGWFKDPKDYNYEKDILPIFNEMEDQLLPVELQHLTKVGQIFSRFDGNSENVGNFSFLTPKVLQKDGYRFHVGSYKDTKSARQTMLFGALATKLLLDDLKKHISGLELKKNDQLIRVYAKKGYIITAGTIGTPKLLLHSGIGRCGDLEQQFVPCRINLPGVGRNLQDHIATGLDLITLNTTLDLGLTDILHPSTILNFFFKNGWSQWSTVGCEAVGFYQPSRKSKEKPVLGFMVLPMGISSDAGACLRENLNIDDESWNHYFHHLQKDQVISIFPVVLQPKSRGYVTISSNNAENHPVVNPQYLTHPDDLHTLMKGIRIIEDELLKLPAMRKLGAQFTQRPLPGCEPFPLFSSQYWECYIKKISFSVYHLGGTCRMGDPNNFDTVVDQSNFLVKGIDNLYIADASVMPTLPSGNMNAAVVVIAKQFIQNLLGREISKNMKETHVKETVEEVPSNLHKSTLKEDL